MNLKEYTESVNSVCPFTNEEINEEFVIGCLIHPLHITSLFFL